MQDQRRHPDRGQDRPDVDLGVHPREGERGLRARALDEVRGPEPHEPLVVGGARSADRAAHRTAPALLDLPERGGQILGGLAPRVVGGSLPARVAAVHDERRCSLRVGGGEQRAHRAALRDAEQRRPLGVDRVQHRSDVVHPLLEGGQLPLGNPIGKTRASLVEQDQTGEGREPRQEPRVGRFLPVQFDVREPAGHVHEIARTGPDHLIGDVRITAPGVPRLRSSHPVAPGGSAYIHGSIDADACMGGASRREPGLLRRGARA